MRPVKAASRIQKLSRRFKNYGTPMKKNNTPIYIAAFVLFTAAIAGLCYAGFNESSVYFLNVSEARALGADKLGRARLFGVVAANGIDRKTGLLEFNLADKDAETLLMPVSFSGAVPDNFKAGAEIIVEGSLNPSGRFMAATLMTKCPSKYQKENRQAAFKRGAL